MANYVGFHPVNKNRGSMKPQTEAEFTQFVKKYMQVWWVIPTLIRDNERARSWACGILAFWINNAR